MSEEKPKKKKKGPPAPPIILDSYEEEVQQTPLDLGLNQLCLSSQRSGMDTAIIDENGISFVKGEGNISGEPLVASGVGASDLLLDERVFLGCGQFGDVYKIQHRDSGELFAVKEIKVPSNETERESLVREIHLLHVCRSADVVSFRGCYYMDEKLNLCMEFMDAGSVESLLGKGGVFPEPAIAKMAISVTSGLHYMKSKHNAIHRDIKPDNMLVNRAGDIKLADFGISNIAEGSVVFTACGTPAYKAPERVDPSTESYDTRADMWSLGISLVEVALGRHPYEVETPPGSGNFVMAQNWAMLNMIMRDAPPTMPADRAFDPDLVDFVANCLVKDRDRRCKPDQMMQHPFIKKHTEPIEISEWVCAVQDGKLTKEDSNGKGAASMNDANATSCRQLFIKSAAASGFSGVQNHNIMHKDPSPYLVVKKLSGGAEKDVCKTSKVHATRSPVWKDMKSTVRLEPAENVLFQVWDHHNLHKDVLLASATVPAPTFEKGGKPLSIPLVGSVNGSKVDVQLVVTYTANLES